MASISVSLIRPLVKEYYNSQSSAGFESSIGLAPPLNLTCIAAVLENEGYKVSIYDCEANGNSEEKLQSHLRSENPDVVGISIITTNFRGALHTAGVVRKTLPGSTIVCGGSHMMIFPEETMSHPEFDYGFIGEAELPLAEFLRCKQAGETDLSGIPGLVRRTREGIDITEPYGFNEDLDSLPFPAYHLLDLSRYRMPNSSDNIVSLFLSRGCPFNCGFCFRNPQLKKVRFKSVDRAIDEIGHMVEKLGVRSINFVDETISLKKEYFLEFCTRLASKGWDLEWQSPTRVTSIDEDILRAAKNSGCHTLRLGIESGSDDILKMINKGISTRKAAEAVSLCRKYGIRTVGYFIIGYLGETEETIKQTIAFAKMIRPDYAAFFPATPMPGTELCRLSEEQGLIPENYWQDFVLGKTDDAIPFIFPDAGDWTGRAYRSFYFSPSYILKHMATVGFYRDIFKNIKVAFNLLLMRFNRK